MSQSLSVPEGAIKVDAPVEPQAKSSTCGPACLAALSRAWHHPFREGDWERATLCDPEGGASPQDVVRALEAQGFGTLLREDWTWGGLQGTLGRATPVLCPVQAHGGGHWVLCVGSDASRVYVQDPLASGVLSHREKGEWLGAWDDVDKNGRRWRRLGIAITRPAAVSRKLPGGESPALDVVDSWLAGKLE